MIDQPAENACSFPHQHNLTMKITQINFLPDYGRNVMVKMKLTQIEAEGSSGFNLRQKNGKISMRAGALLWDELR